ncbi:MAG: SDR family oxidoreductase [Schumannella sp.]|nr:SDR family oxidoreductase [Microbacteriaceae bacterium]
MSTVLVTGATGATGRAVCALLTARGDTVLAVGTDASRLEGVDAAERLVADLTDPAACEAIAADVATRHGSLDGILHLVGGWKPGWGDEVTDWLNARLVTSLRNVSEAFEGMLLAAPAGRLAIVSSTVVTHDGPPTSAYAAAKLGAEAWVAQLNARWAGKSAGAVTFVVRSIGEDDVDAVAAALADVASRAPGERVLL